MNRITNEQREAIVREAIAKRDRLLTGAPLADYPREDQEFYRFWYGHMLNDLMQPPLANVSHAEARYIWDAAIRAAMKEHPSSVSPLGPGEDEYLSWVRLLERQRIEGGMGPA